jgi:hypothetical protein
MKCRLSWSLLTNFSFHDGTSEDTVWGKTLFIYITEGIYIGSASLKTLPLDLEPPLQGKEYDPPYSKLSVKSKKILPKPLIDPWFGFLHFHEI